MTAEAAPDMTLPFIIGEAGSCHEEVLGRAIQLVNVAGRAGCQAVKFQFWSSPKRMRQRRKVTTSGAYDTGSIRKEWMPYLRQTAKNQNILFGVSVFLPEDVPTVSPQVDFLKVSSFEARDQALVDAVMAARGDRPVFISTGLSEERPLIPLEAIRLHCVSAYPCPLAEANLAAIEPHEGYSDHTRCVLTGGFAVSAGADYLEVHFRLTETSTNCPDHVVSLTPEELRNYVTSARAAAVMRGTGEVEIQPSERENLVHRVLG